MEDDSFNFDRINEKIHPRKRLKGRKGCFGAGPKGSQMRMGKKIEKCHEFETVVKVPNEMCDVDPEKEQAFDDGLEYGRNGTHSRYRTFREGVKYSLNKKNRWKLKRKLENEGGYYSKNVIMSNCDHSVPDNTTFADHVKREIIKKRQEEIDEQPEESHLKEVEAERIKKRTKNNNKLSKRRHLAPRKKRRMRKGKKIQLKKKKSKNMKNNKTKDKKREICEETITQNRDFYDFEVTGSKRSLFRRPRGNNRSISPEWAFNLLGRGNRHHAKRRENLKKDIKSVFSLK